MPYFGAKPQVKEGGPVTPFIQQTREEGIFSQNQPPDKYEATAEEDEPPSKRSNELALRDMFNASRIEYPSDSESVGPSNDRPIRSLFRRHPKTQTSQERMDKKIKDANKSLRHMPQAEASAKAQDAVSRDPSLTLTSRRSFPLLGRKRDQLARRK